MHGAEFDVKTGKMLSPPKEIQFPGLDQLPEKFVEYLAEVGRLMAPVKTHDMRTYEVDIRDDIIRVRI
jgi:nitrite reductase/ring-hydroxylating ferredoxin subunit